MDTVTGSRIPAGEMTYAEALAWLVSLGQCEFGAAGTLLTALKMPRALICNGTAQITCDRKPARFFRVTPLDRWSNPLDTRPGMALKTGDIVTVPAPYRTDRRTVVVAAVSADGERFTDTNGSGHRGADAEIADGTRVIPVGGDWLAGQPHVVRGYDPATCLYDLEYAAASRTKAGRRGMPLRRELYVHEFMVEEG